MGESKWAACAWPLIAVFTVMLVLPHQETRAGCTCNGGVVKASEYSKDSNTSPTASGTAELKNSFDLIGFTSLGKVTVHVPAPLEASRSASSFAIDCAASF